jgi:hypothetical protein
MREGRSKGVQCSRASREVIHNHAQENVLKEDGIAANIEDLINSEWEYLLSHSEFEAFRNRIAQAKQEVTG